MSTKKENVCKNCGLPSSLHIPYGGFCLPVPKPRRRVTSAEKTAVKLREVALAFAKHSGMESEDQHDRKGQRLNKALLKAAINYAKSCEDQ